MKKIFILTALTLGGVTTYAKPTKKRLPAQAAPQSLECTAQAADNTGWQDLMKKNTSFGPDTVNPSSPGREVLTARTVLDVSSPYGHKFTIDADAISSSITGLSFRSNNIIIALFVNDVEFQFIEDQGAESKAHMFNLKDKKTGKNVMYRFACSIK